ncbi:MAG: Quinoprotein glucose dehydrogenase [Herbinix sp.]|jgi:glucose/arabinose dehydrogenase|nr:Quinoprotein glucose dehydrogenase [Herbinix sp.]
MKGTDNHALTNRIKNLTQKDRVRAFLLTPEEFPYNIEVVAENLRVPWAMEMSQEGKLYFTERSGNIKIIENGVLLPEPLITFTSPFVSRGEGGLLGMAIDPDFSENHYIYVMHTYTSGGKVYNRVVRLVELNDRASIDRVLIDEIPGGLSHDGGRIKIGPDRKLYITTGDAGNARLAQDINSLAGKILRINLDGTIPEDNPIANSPIYSYGHRNGQGLAWSEDHILYESEHGQTAHDEINRIVPGANYGWPVVEGEEASEESGFMGPIVESGDVTWAPAGITFVNQGPWQGKLLVTNLYGEQLLVMTFNDEGTGVVQVEPWLTDEFGRLREVYQAEDGSIYLATSNRDGRGGPAANDDRILRLVPKIS